MFKKILVSGGAGFIGSHLVERLLTIDSVERVLIYDNFLSGKIEHLDKVIHDGRLSFVTADIKDLQTLTKSMQGMDTVFHLASNPDIAKAIVQPDIDFWEGTYLTQNILEAMRINNVKKIFYTSGSGIYGENASMEFPEDYGPLLPISTYGASKLAGEALISSYCHMFNIVARVFRFANVVGPRQTHGVGFDFVRKLRKDPSKLNIFGDGTQSKSYIFVEDVLDAILLCDEKSNKNFDYFNVATGDYITVSEIAHLAVNEMNIDPKSIVFEYSGGDRGWKGDVPIIRFDISKINSLGWHAKNSSKEAIRKSIRAMIEETK